MYIYVLQAILPASNADNIRPLFALGSIEFLRKQFLKIDGLNETIFTMFLETRNQFVKNSLVSSF
jgi:hypothetical protein